MTRPFVAALALALAAACGGGGDAEPAASPTAATPTPTPTPTLIGEAAKVRAATAALRSACPCAIEMSLFANVDETPYRLGLTGTYDPKAGTAELHGSGDDKGVVVRVVGGRTFLNPDTGTWIELDFSALRDKKPASALGAAALADPAIAFAGGANATVATVSMPRDNATFYDTEIDPAGFLAASGPRAEMLRGVIDDRAPGGSVGLGKKGEVVQTSLNLPGEDGLSAYSTILWVRKTGVKHPNVTVPQVVNKVDVATFKG